LIFLTHASLDATPLITPPGMSSPAFSGQVLVVEDNPIHCMVIEALLDQLSATMVRPNHHDS